ncbi:hypothetical protein ISF_06733 [Cordyceps fumosorosea ARSEF 2679]|uniref:Life-span regulatory factor n=1 Tax=Cordyceps fumosorosea (strain ARSEF 2679) TaxID=1081104 RepID=A0A167R1X3_CORFA|nr:hypothetical protein ISF_06733 [Cordyceps fumosorosea ARSEF 2679]OAA58194.1 hypothetical protein ISF_06733 [Cordyceps fumosorosea ARSEF 2679]
MSLDLWTHQYCLACDKQVHDADAYCSESCRLADFEKSPSSPSSQASSPGFAPSSGPWSTASSAPSSSGRYTSRGASKFYLSPAYDFSNAQPYGTTPTAKPLLGYYSGLRSDRLPAQPSSLPIRQLTPSSSHSSLCSMQSNASDASRLSDGVKKELQAYAVSFEQVRLQRRRSQ